MAHLELQFDRISEGHPYHASLVTVSGGWRERPAPHGHQDFCEIFYVTDGQGTQRLSKEDVRLRRGDLAVIGPGDHHEFAAGAGTPLRFVNIAFPARAWKAFTSLTLGPSCSWLSSPRSMVVPVSEDPDLVEAEFQRALLAFNASPTALDLARFWSHVTPHLVASRPDHSGERGSPPEWLASACRAMEDEANLREGLPRLVELAAVSSSHLVRVMRRHYGCTPVTYINERRLAQSALLLATSARSITQIASDCGFESASYFTRRFRQRYDMSPREYRRQRQETVVPEHHR